MRTNRSLIVLLVLALCVSVACQRKPTQVDNKINPQFTVAVAPFTVATEPWELISGYLPDHTVPPKADALDELDAILIKSLKIGPDRNVVAGNKVAGCMQSVRKPADATRMSTIKYWQEVGKCMEAQYLLVPVAVHWKERQGSAAGSTSPAWVILDLYLVNVKTGGLVNHFRYDYQQKALTDNILEADKFLKRKGQWVTAADLSREGIEKGLKELGL
ncbi:hypothetical protein [Fundidesulfovibrio soli]|uniref:hypothetical protein n=1 Tax=Fundidesulfovibrio soli TaxID=2922716 RepID=UPI001FAE7797|nr:hypothetical protein [Fundidesulfovibrio soli]